MDDIRCKIIDDILDCKYATLGNGFFGCTFKDDCLGKRPYYVGVLKRIEQLEKEVKKLKKTGKE